MNIMHLLKGLGAVRRMANGVSGAPASCIPCISRKYDEVNHAAWTRCETRNVKVPKYTAGQGISDVSKQFFHVSLTR